MTHELDVWLFACRVGTLTPVSGRLMFRYATEWLVRTDAVPLSHSLPLRPESFDDHAARPFFAGLLPEGRLRRLIAHQLHVSGQNDFALLDHIGGECAGAVTFLEPGQPLLQQSSGGDVEWLSDEGIVAILEELPRRPMLAGRDGLRLSLAGAQDKLPVTVDGNRIGLPRDGTASTHILKPLIPALEDSVTNEGFCLALAEAVGLKAARSHTATDRANRKRLREADEIIENFEAGLNSFRTVTAILTFLALSCGILKTRWASTPVALKPCSLRSHLPIALTSLSHPRERPSHIFALHHYLLTLSVSIINFLSKILHEKPDRQNLE